MIFTYGSSIQGDDHISWGTNCQDAHRIETLANGWVIAAVADGVGSAKYSEFGSRLAVDTVVDFCIDNMPFNGTVISAENGLIPLLRVAYYKAFKNILELSQTEDNRFEDYDTTLDVVIYNGEGLIYGHCSDGGIIALNDSGYYDCVTQPMKGSDGESMIPLRFTEKWQFGIYSKSSSAVMLFTDGIYEFVHQNLLLKHWTTPFYVNLLSHLSNTKVLTKNPEKMIENIDSLLNNTVWNSVTDDKTLVSLINLEKDTTIVEDEYYREPDWEVIRAKLNKILYGNDFESTEQYSDHENPANDMKQLEMFEEEYETHVSKRNRKSDTGFLSKLVHKINKLYEDEDD